MIKRTHIYPLFLTLVIFLSAFCGQAQQVGTKIDRNQILIGERIRYDVMINIPEPGYSVQFDIPENIPHFDIVEPGTFDTTGDNGSYSLHREIVFTSFDSGAWHIPSFPVTLVKNNSYKKFLTDSVLVNVGYSPADSTNQLRDIKPVMEVPEPDYFWYYVAAALLLLLIIGLIVYFIKTAKKKSPFPGMDAALKPFDEAMAELEKLKALNLSNAEEVKKYHTGLSYILKRYYSRMNRADYLNTTTSDFLVNLKEWQPGEPDVLSKTAESLRIGNAVKFAKFVPTVPESEQCLEVTRNCIESSAKQNQQPKQ